MRVKMRRSESNSVYAAMQRTRVLAAQDIVVSLDLDRTVRASPLFRPKLVNIMVLIGRSSQLTVVSAGTPRGRWTDGSSQKLCLLRITPSCQFPSRLRCTHRGVYIRSMQKRAISFRFDQADLDRWKVIAGRSGLTLSEWIRRRVNGGPTTTRVHRDRGVGENERPTSALPKIETLEEKHRMGLEWAADNPEDAREMLEAVANQVAVQPKEEIENSKTEDPIGNDGMDLPRGGARSAGRLSGGDQCKLPPPCKHGAHPGMCRHAECREGWKLKQ